MEGKIKKNEKHSQTIKTDEFYMLVHDEKKKKRIIKSESFIIPL